MRKLISVFIFSIIMALFVGCGEINSGKLSEPGTTNLPESAVSPVQTSLPETPCPVEIAPVKVAVIDTGFSPHCIPAESVLEGKNYLYPEKSCDDTYGHGTAVASIILRYAPETLLVPLVSNAYEDGEIIRVDNGTLAQMIRDAVDVYACDIINISAGLVLDKAVVREAVEYAEEQNVLVVASVGNDYDLNGSMPYYPAAYETVLAVGALNEEGTELASFSQRGEWVDVYAIGENVTIGTLSGNTRTSDGTSYSAAKITALAVRVLQEWQRSAEAVGGQTDDTTGNGTDISEKKAENISWDVEQLREAILNQAKLIGDGIPVIPCEE